MNRRHALMVSITIIAAVTATRVGWAAEAENIALRGGETADLGPVFWISNCRSMLTGTPVVEVMEGPSDLSAIIKAQKVNARNQKCSKQVDGGELTISAGPDIKAREQGKMFLRVKYQTKDGERQKSREIDYTLFPKQ